MAQKGVKLPRPFESVNQRQIGNPLQPKHCWPETVVPTRPCIATSAVSAGACVSRSGDPSQEPTPHSTAHFHLCDASLDGSCEQNAGQGLGLRARDKPVSHITIAGAHAQKHSTLQQRNFSLGVCPYLTYCHVTSVETTELSNDARTISRT